MKMWQGAHRNLTLYLPQEQWFDIAYSVFAMTL